MHCMGVCVRARVCVCGWVRVCALARVRAVPGTSRLAVNSYVDRHLSEMGGGG